MRILMITRPIGEPWNEGGKNLAYNIARNIKNHKINLLQTEDDPTLVVIRRKLETNIVARHHLDVVEPHLAAQVA